MWRALEIRIYDIYNRYDIHRRRLINVLEDLDIGLIVGEGWSRDYVRVLMALDVYSIKVYTFLEPQELKKRLVGLEWDNFGNRLADYDLFEGRKKVSWGQTRGDRKESREVFSARCRDELLAQLSDEGRDELLSSDVQLRAREKSMGGRPVEE